MKIDSHIHFGLPGKYSDVIEALELTHMDRGNLVAQIDSRKVNETLDCLMVKKFTDRIYVYGALDLSLYYDLDLMKKEMVNYVKTILECGCDGIKMLEGKPTDRYRYPIPNFDSEYFEPYFKFMEDTLTPIVWHVNDPEEFWDEELCPDWAKRSGWLYDDKFINNIDQYNQIDKVLERHPNLVITFAHFYFLSNNLKKLEDMFKKYPNVRIDITPGVELFTNLSKNIKDAREFFNKYSDRIVYGTDICVYLDRNSFGLDKIDSIDRYNLCTEFLSKEKFTIIGRPNSLLGSEDVTINGLGLNQDKIDNIMYKNFLNSLNRLDKEPKKLNIDLINKELDNQKERIIKLSKYTNKELNYQYLEELRLLFNK